MKKRIGKIDTDAIVFSNTDKTAEELLELFLQEKQAFSLSDETISLYRYHCMQFIQSLGSVKKEPGYTHVLKVAYFFGCQIPDPQWHYLISQTYILSIPVQNIIIRNPAGMEQNQFKCPDPLLKYTKKLSFSVV